MSEFSFYPEKYQKKLRDNYIAFFLKQASSQYLEANYPTEYIKHSLHSMSLFGDWLQKMRIPLQVVDRQHINMFVEYAKSHLPRRSVHVESARKRTAKLAVSLIRKHSPPPMDRSPIPQEIVRYVNYLRDQRDLADFTIAAHRNGIHEFLRHFFSKRKISIRQIKPKQINQFFQLISPSPHNSKRRRFRAILKGYFQYLEIHGTPTRHLIAAIPLISVPRRAPSPCLVSEKELKLLLNSIDHSSRLGKRTHATILCLNDLGIRIGDVTRINLDNLDWRGGTICIGNHKTSASFLLPMSQRVGNALATYIKDARPISKSRRVFLNHYSRSGGTPATEDALKVNINKQWKTAGLFGKLSGTHIFRRSMATHLLEKGIPLKEIADFLGHRTIESTALYTQIDLSSLRQVAQSWPIEGDCQ
ncbi:MAG: site-specific integrase [Planctomycetaceae bacterium]|jgi:site-specific recombinase XerD|nr:site-specific integrase [Planctomycetaceae bacterium]